VPQIGELEGDFFKENLRHFDLALSPEAVLKFAPGHVAPKSQYPAGRF
jgi:hypothetical protein